MFLPAKDWTPLIPNEPFHNDLPVNPTLTESAVLRNGASTKKFSSRKPNNALLWALIDDSELGREAHEEALAIMDNWQPQPFPGTVWRGPSPWKGARWPGVVGEGLEWNGSSWEAVTDQPVDYKPYQPKTSLENCSHSAKVFSEPLPELEAATELNQQYTAWVKDPKEQRESLHLTLSAFVASHTWRKAQVRMLLAETTACVQADEIFSEFVFELQRRMDRGQYKHTGKLDGWIATIWDKYFFPEQQRKLWDFTNAVRFINNVDPGAAEYRHDEYCVNTERIASDAEQDETGYLHRGKRESDGKIVTYRITGDRILRELDDPTTELGQVSDLTKRMLKGIAAGSSQREIASELKVSDRTLRRRLESVAALFPSEAAQ
jgi:hypothetical protein